MTPRRRRVLIAAATVAAVVGFAAWLTLFRQQFPSFADDVEHFKYRVGGRRGRERAAWYLGVVRDARRVRGPPAGQGGLRALRLHLRSWTRDAGRDAGRTRGVRAHRHQLRALPCRQRAHIANGAAPAPARGANLPLRLAALPAVPVLLRREPPIQRGCSDGGHRSRPCAAAERGARVSLPRDPENEEGADDAGGAAVVDGSQSRVGTRPLGPVQSRQGAAAGARAGWHRRQLGSAPAVEYEGAARAPLGRAERFAPRDRGQFRHR